jgi:hypothetical protein
LTKSVQWRLWVAALLMVTPFIVLFNLAADLNNWQSLACTAPIWLLARRMLGAWYAA